MRMPADTHIYELAPSRGSMRTCPPASRGRSARRGRRPACPPSSASAPSARRRRRRAPRQPDPRRRGSAGRWSSRRAPAPAGGLGRPARTRWREGPRGARSPRPAGRHQDGPDRLGVVALDPQRPQGGDGEERPVVEARRDHPQRAGGRPNPAPPPGARSAGRRWRPQAREPAFSSRRAPGSHSTRSVGPVRPRPARAPAPHRWASSWRGGSSPRGSVTSRALPS